MFQYENVSIEQAHHILEGGSCLVLDIRDGNSFEQGRLPGAQRFNDQIIRRMRKMGQRHAPILIYCYHGTSSKDIAKLLCSVGFTNVYNLNGGYTAWQAATNM